MIRRKFYTNLKDDPTLLCDAFFDGVMFWFELHDHNVVKLLGLLFTDESEDEGEDGEDTFMHSYSDALNKELKSTTLEKSFVRADEQAPKKDEVWLNFLNSYMFDLIWLRMNK